MRTIIIFSFCLALSACKCKPKPDPKPDPFPNPSGRYFRFITLDSANKMIDSYLGSINSQANDTDIRALVVDMDQLRKYTDSMPGGRQIKYLKLILGHSLEYINGGRGNQDAGYRSNALTLIIAGCDINGNYIYFTGNRVLEYCMPCPSNCPPGNAGNALLSR